MNQEYLNSHLLERSALIRPVLYFHVIEDVFIVMKEVNGLHPVGPNGHVIEDQTVDQSVLHPPEQLRLILHYAVGRDGDVLECLAMITQRCTVFQG